ncbi:MAG: hypothetical protein WBX25_32880 [Rhodomicrobium sp.]
MAANALFLAGIDLYFGNSHILQDVSFDLDEGIVLGLLRRNGAGLVPRRPGSIAVFGRDVAGFTRGGRHFARFPELRICDQPLRQSRIDYGSYFSRDPNFQPSPQYLWDIHAI